jgi:hypothetical protein
VGSPEWRAANADKVRGYWRAWYYRNRAQVAAAKKRRREALRSWVQEYKADLACSACGETHPVTLEFHHREPGEKEFTVGEAAQHRWSRRKVESEIAKCELLCANCHRKLHSGAL